MSARVPPPPPLLSRGLIRPDRTLAQLRQDLPASSPRTPTPWERTYRLYSRKARIWRWLQIGLVGVFLGQWLFQRSPYRLYISLAFGSWGLIKLYGLLPWVDTEVDGFWAWWETKRGVRERLWNWIRRRFLKSLRFVGYLVVTAFLMMEAVYSSFIAIAAWLRGEGLSLPRGTQVERLMWRWREDGAVPVAITAANPDAAVTTPAAPKQRVIEREFGTWKKDGDFIATRYSRDFISPRALRVLGIPFLPGTPPYWVAVLEKLDGMAQGSLSARTQYYRRRGRGLVSQEERDEYDEDGDDEDDLKLILPLPSIPPPVRYIPPPGTLQTKLYRRFASIDALRNMRLPFEIWNHEYIIVQQALGFEQIQEIYGSSQMIRRRREGLGHILTDEDDGYDFGQTGGESGSCSEESDTASEGSGVPLTPRVPRTYAAGPERFRQRTSMSSNLDPENDTDMPPRPRQSSPYSQTSGGRKENVRSTARESEYPLHHRDRTSQPYSSTARRTGSYAQSSTGQREGVNRKNDDDYIFNTSRRSHRYASTSDGRKEDLRPPGAEDQNETAADDREPRPYSETTRRTGQYASTSSGRKEDLRPSGQDDQNETAAEDREPRPYSNTTRRTGRYASRSDGRKEDLRPTGQDDQNETAAEDREPRPYSNTARRTGRYASTSSGRKEDLRPPGQHDQNEIVAEDREPRPYAETTRRTGRYAQQFRGQNEDLNRSPQSTNNAQSRDRPPQRYSQTFQGRKHYVRRAHEESQESAPRKRPARWSSKRNWLVPKRGGDEARPIYLPIQAESIRSNPLDDGQQDPINRRSSRSTPYSSRPEQPRTTPPPRAPQEAQSHPIPEPAVNKEGPTKPTNFTPRPGRQSAQPESESESEGDDTASTPPSSPPSTPPSTPPPSRPPAATPRSPPPSFHIPAPPRGTPMDPPRASQPLLRNSASKVSSLRADCIGLWTRYHALLQANQSIDLQLQSQKLLQQVAALAETFERIFDVQPRMSIPSYQSNLEAMEMDLDDITGLLQLFRQTLDAENPACPVLRKARACVHGIVKGVAEVQDKRYGGLDDSVSDARRQRLRRIIPEFAIEDERTARRAEEKRDKEKETREKAAKEKAEKEKAAEQAEIDRVNAMLPIDVEPTGPSLRRPSEQSNKNRKAAKIPGLSQSLGIRGPPEMKAALRTRIEQGFLPAPTSPESFLCGIRALIISLESMGKLRIGSLEPSDLLTKMFIDPQIDPHFDIESFPEGEKGQPTEEYEVFLAEKAAQWEVHDSSIAEEAYINALSKHNFDSTQLSYMLELLHRFGLMPNGGDLVLGIVTAGLPGGQATVQIHNRTDHVIHDSVVWVYNDNHTAASGGRGLGHWSGFSKNASGREYWLEVVEKWGLNLAEESPQDPDQENNVIMAGASDTTNGNNAASQGKTPRQGTGGHQDGARNLAHLQELVELYEKYIQAFDEYQTEAVIDSQSIDRMIDVVENEFIPKVQAIRNIGTREERHHIIQTKRRLEDQSAVLVYEIQSLWDRRSGEQPAEEVDDDELENEVGDNLDNDNAGGFRRNHRGRSGPNGYEPDSDLPPGARCGNGGGNRGRGEQRGGQGRGRGNDDRGGGDRQQPRSESRQGYGDDHDMGNGDSGGGYNGRGRGGQERGGHGRGRGRGGADRGRSRSEEPSKQESNNYAGFRGRGGGHGGDHGFNDPRGGYRGNGEGGGGRGNPDAGYHQEPRNHSGDHDGNQFNGFRGRGGYGRDASNAHPRPGPENGNGGRGGTRGGRSRGRGQREQ